MLPEELPQPLAPVPDPIWRRLLKRLTKPYIWLPATAGLVLVAVAGAYWVVNSQSGNQQPVSEGDVAVESSSRTAEQQSESEKAKEKDSTKEKKTEAKSTTKPAQGGGSEGGAPSPPASQPPAGLVKPNSGNTGPRYSTTRILTPDQAMAELRNRGKLSRVKISGSLRLSGSDGRNWLIEDSIIVTTRNYGIQAYNSIGSFTGAKSERPVFRYVEIIGSAATDGSRCSAVVYGSDIVLQHADLYGCDDGIKAGHRVDVISSWMHDNDHPSGAHCDAIQIRSGTDILIRGSRLDAYIGYSSDGSQVPSGSTCSGGLQTGSVSGPISARWENNWFAGGHYTIRGASSDSPVSYVFKNNKWMRHGTSVTLGLTNLPPNRYGPVTSHLGDFDSSNVWEDTGQPVRD